MKLVYPVCFVFLFDFLCIFFVDFQAYIGFINKHDQTLMDLENEINKSDKLRKACKEFEVAFGSNFYSFFDLQSLKLYLHIIIRKILLLATESQYEF